MTDDGPGEPKTHRWHLTGALRQNLYGTVIGIIFTLLLVLCLFVPFKTPADKWATCVALGVTVALCYLPIGLGLLFRPTTVTASAEGLAWRGLSGSGEKTWAEVANVYRKDILNVGNARGTTWVTFRSGPTLRLGQALTDYNELADRIQEVASRARMAEARTALAAGEWEAGLLTLRTDGLEIGKVHISWANLNGYTLINGQLFFLGTSPELEKVKGVWLRDVPNYQLIFQLLDERGLVYRSWSPASGLSPIPSNDAT